MCGIWCNAKVTFLQLCSKEILGESHGCGQKRNEGMKQILPLRAIILYKLLGTSIPPEPRAGGGLQHPLATAVWQELGWEPAFCAPSKAHWARWAPAQAVVSTSRILWLPAIRMPGYSLSWQRRGTQCLSVWRHGLMVSGLDLFPSHGTKIWQRRYNGGGMKINWGFLKGGSVLWSQANTVPYWLISQETLLCSEEILKVSSITSEIRTTWPDLCGFLKNSAKREVRTKSSINADCFVITFIIFHDSPCNSHTDI